MILRIQKLAFLVSLATSASLSLGCASAPTDEGATTMEAESALKGGTKVFLNHTYGVFSAATISALKTDAYLQNEFVDVELRTTVRGDTTYTGTYLNARETYLECFQEGEFFGNPVGVSGLGISDEKTGGLQVVSDRWKTAFGADQVDPTVLKSHEINGVQVPWFNQASLVWADNSTYSGVWAMEYLPNAGQTAPRTRREERAARYAPQKLAQNVEALIYGYPDEDRDNVRRTLGAAGWSTASLGTGWIATSPFDHGARRVIVGQKSAPGRLGLLGVIWRLNRRVAVHTEPLGDATLKVGLFGLPYAALWLVPTSATDEASAMGSVNAGSADSADSAD